MKRLFKVVDRKGANVGQSQYYNNKMEAKADRNHLNGDDDLGYRIAKGPDHMGKHGSYGPAPMRRQPKRV